MTDDEFWRLVIGGAAFATAPIWFAKLESLMERFGYEKSRKPRKSGSKVPK